VPSDEPVGNGTKDNSQQNWSCVVHIRSSYWKLRRERHPDDDENKVNEREYVHSDAPFAEFEWPELHWWATDLS